MLALTVVALYLLSPSYSINYNEILGKRKLPLAVNQPIMSNGNLSYYNQSLYNFHQPPSISNQALGVQQPYGFRHMNVGSNYIGHFTNTPYISQYNISDVSSTHSSEQVYDLGIAENTIKYFSKLMNSSLPNAQTDRHSKQEIHKNNKITPAEINIFHVNSPKNFKFQCGQELCSANQSQKSLAGSSATNLPFTIDTDRFVKTIKSKLEDYVVTSYLQDSTDQLTDSTIDNDLSNSDVRNDYNENGVVTNQNNTGRSYEFVNNSKMPLASNINRPNSTGLRQGYTFMLNSPIITSSTNPKRPKKFRPRLLSEQNLEDKFDKLFAEIKADENSVSILDTDLKNKLVKIQLNKKQEHQLPEEKKVKFSPNAIESINNTIKYKGWTGGGARDTKSQTSGVTVGKDNVFKTNNKIGLAQKELTSTVTVKDKVKTITDLNLSNDSLNQGVFVNGYGAQIYRENDQNALGAKLSTPDVTIGTMANVFDRDYGVKVRYKDKEIGIRHDFDQNIFKDTKTPATETFVNWGKLNLNTGTDLSSNRYSVGLGYDDIYSDVLFDVDQRSIELSSKLPDSKGNKWDFFINTDVPDDKSSTIKTVFGINDNKKLKVQAGAGIGNDGIPELSGLLGLKNVGIGLGYLGTNNAKRNFNVDFNIADFKYNWNSTLDLEKIPVPLLFGFNPNIISESFNTFLFN